MTVTVSKYFIVVCDNKGCKNKFQCRDIDLEWPGKWKSIKLAGWCGEFHACSFGCEMAIREYHENTRAK